LRLIRAGVEIFNCWQQEASGKGTEVSALTGILQTSTSGLFAMFCRPKKFSKALAPAMDAARPHRICRVRSVSMQTALGRECD
jgi:hypothetical protein